MKVLKIRFIEEFEAVDSPIIVYYLQQKSLFGWKYFNNASSSNKEALLNDFVDSKYPNYRKAKILLIEYPSIKYYNLVSDES
jgi:hypothetical protein